MHRFDTVLFEPGFEGQVEIRGIDADEYIRLVRQQSITQGMHESPRSRGSAAATPS